jgi:hypothetical protein
MKAFIKDRSTWPCRAVSREIGMLLSECVYDISEYEADGEVGDNDDTASQDLCLFSLRHCRAISFDFLDEENTFTITVDTVSNNSLTFGGSFTDKELGSIRESVYRILALYTDDSGASAGTILMKELEQDTVDINFLFNNSLCFGTDEIALYSESLIDPIVIDVSE